jgi:hypothetical protein
VEEFKVPRSTIRSYHPTLTEMIAHIKNAIHFNRINKSALLAKTPAELLSFIKRVLKTSEVFNISEYKSLVGSFVVFEEPGAMLSNYLSSHSTIGKEEVEKKITKYVPPARRESSQVIRRMEPISFSTK